MRKLLLALGVLLSLGIFCACSSDDEVFSTSPDIDENYFCGTIQLFDHEELGKYVFIDVLKMPEGDDKYRYIKTVVVPKDKFPLLDYHTGDIISFVIVEVESEFPSFRDAMHSYPPSTQFLCSIELYK